MCALAMWELGTGEVPLVTLAQQQAATSCPSVPGNVRCAHPATPPTPTAPTAPLTSLAPCVCIWQFGEIDIDSSLVVNQVALEGGSGADTVTTLANGGSDTGGQAGEAGSEGQGGSSFQSEFDRGGFRGLKGTWRYR